MLANKGENAKVMRENTPDRRLLREYRERSALKDADFARKSEKYREAKAYWLNVHQLCDGDLTYLERKQAEQRLIDELA